MNRKKSRFKYILYLIFGLRFVCSVLEHRAAIVKHDFFHYKYVKRSLICFYFMFAIENNLNLSCLV